MANGVESIGNRVLVIFPGALGDLICLLPALRALARRYAGQSFELMARGELAEFAVGRTPSARAYSIDRREVSLLFSAAENAAARAAEFFRAFASIHSFFGFDNDRVREVLPRACSGGVFFHRFRPAGPGHVSAAYLGEIGESPVSDHPEPASYLNLSGHDLEQARHAAAAFGATEDRFILLMPGSGAADKNWPAEKYLELARHLGSSIPVLTVLGPAEAKLAPVFSNLPTIRSPDLGTLAGLARLSSAFVGNDSGVSHLAAASGARGVVIFGPTDPERWRPLGKVKIIAQRALQELPWQQVAEALRKLPPVQTLPADTQ
jgi:heptosyltransferase-3